MISEYEISDGKESRGRRKKVKSTHSWPYSFKNCNFWEDQCCKSVLFNRLFGVFTPSHICYIRSWAWGASCLVCSHLKKFEESESIDIEDYVPAIAIVGRPNVGKSSILNAVVGEDRTIVSPVSGTTRDSIDTEYVAPDGKKFHLIDTTGIRRRVVVASSGSATEALSVNRALRAIRRSDVVTLVIEAMACISEQEIALLVDFPLLRFRSLESLHVNLMRRNEFLI